MNKEQINDAIKAWEKIKTQATIDIEQADLYISALKQKQKEIEDK